MAAAAIALSSTPVPRRESTDLYSPSWITPTRAADMPVSPKRVMRTRSTGTPRLRAARSLPPLAKIQLPNFERSSTALHMPRSAMNQIAETWIPLSKR